MQALRRIPYRIHSPASLPAKSQMVPDKFRRCGRTGLFWTVCFTHCVVQSKIQYHCQGCYNGRRDYSYHMALQYNDGYVPGCRQPDQFTRIIAIFIRQNTRAKVLKRKDIRFLWRTCFSVRLFIKRSKVYV